MPMDIFLQAVKQLAEGRLDAMAAIGTAESINQAGRPDLGSQLYQLWINCHPSSPLLYVAYFNLGMSLSAAGDPVAARHALEQSLANNADFHPARLNLGVLSASAGDTDQALGEWANVVARLNHVNPENLRYKKMALRYRAYHFEQAQHYADAEAVLKQCLDLDAHQVDVSQHLLSLRQEQCIWPIVVPSEGMSRDTLIRTMLPLSLAAYADDPALQLACAWNYSRSFKPPTVNLARLRDHEQGAPARRRKVGYLSSDLRAHAVGYLVPEVFELHNREEFEVFAYYCGPPSNEGLNTRLKGAVEHWVDLTGMDDEAAAKRIAADGIDILVDLNGHTRDARTVVVSMRPAPIIVNWLGYPGTMGSPYHHYIIADDWIVPEDHEIHFSEKILRLPCYQPNDRKRSAAAVSQSRKDYGLPDEATVYCCFNSAHKITRFTFERWMRILREVPGSVLWLFETSSETSKRLLSLAEQQGVEPERLVFAPKLANPVHLARYPVADLFLDTAPYGAHTTGSDALWMGLPILTLSGHSFASRVCGSLVRAAGLPELVCTSPEEYVERAVVLGNDRQKLQRLKEQLVSTRASCTLFNMDLHVRSLEALYRQMWNEFQDGRLPVPDLANLDVYLEVAAEEDYDQTDVLAIANHREWFCEKLVRRHHLQPIMEDRRLWTQS